jgi:superfamily I DNA/RNA helicase
MTRDEIIDRRDWTEFSELVGEPITGHYDVDTGVIAGKRGDQMLRVVDYASTTGMSLSDAFDEVGPEAVDWFAMKRFAESFQLYKQEVAKLDFTDLLTFFIEEGKSVPNVRVAVIDEAQDLTPVQWKAVQIAFRDCEKIYFGGDDDQAIYRWAGADIDHFLSLSSNPQVLEVSHRLPKQIWKLAHTITSRISRRYKKPYRYADRDGAIDWHFNLGDVDLRGKEGDWLLLARNGYMLDQLEELAQSHAIPYSTRKGPAIDPIHIEAIELWVALQRRPERELAAAEVRALYKAMGLPRPALRELGKYCYANFEGLPSLASTSWHQAFSEGISKWRLDYYADCLRNQEDLKAIPRIRIETIHGVKGAEASNVLLMTDISSRTARSFQDKPDHEHRVFYVGVTRARESLELIAPQSFNSYPVL